MKVLIITDAWHPQVNGVVRTYEHLGEELTRRGHEVRVIGPSDFPVRMPMPGYREIKLALFPYRRLEKMIDGYKPDSIHIATEGPLGWAARRYCLRHDEPYTTTYHTHFPDYVAKRIAWFLPFSYGIVHELAKKYVRTFHAHSHTMMVATQSLEDQLRSWNFKAPMHRLTRGAKFDQFYPGPKNLFKNLPQPVALFVGRVAIEKNIEDFLSMKWAGSKIVVGEGPRLEEFRAKYPNAHFVGRKSGKELADHYRSADVFVFPSRTDTFGMVLVEALACGIPVAGYNVTGPRDIVTENFLGVIHDNDLSLAAHKALTCGTAQQRADYVRSYYTWDNAGRQFEDALFPELMIQKKNGSYSAG